MSLNLSRVFVALVLLAVVEAADSTNLANSKDILADLTQYDKLYVSYHSCAWSAYADGCGVEGGNDQYWYRGLTECYRTNVGYSLYGVMTGAKDQGCSKATFINSFFTTTGIETFTAYMAAAGISFSATDDEGNQISSECNMVDDNNDNNNGQQNNEEVDYTANNRKIYEGDSSTGVGCVNGAFAMKQYSGIYCDERSEPLVTDTLVTFNEEISQAQCVIIHDATNNNDDQQQEENKSIELLQYSEACDIRNFPKDCPDPYGILNKVAVATSHQVAREAHPNREIVKMVFSWILLVLGIILMLASAWAYYRKRQARKAALENQEANNKKSKGFFGNKRNNNNGKTQEKKTGFWGKLRKGNSRS